MLQLLQILTKLRGFPDRTRERRSAHMRLNSSARPRKRSDNHPLRPQAEVRADLHIRSTQTVRFSLHNILTCIKHYIPARQPTVALCKKPLTSPVTQGLGWSEAAATNAPVEDEAVQAVLGMNQKPSLFPAQGFFSPLLCPKIFPSYLPSPLLPTSPHFVLTPSSQLRSA